MAHWRNEYSAALAARDRREKANVALYNAYTQLADRTARIASAGAQGAQNLTGAGDKHTVIAAAGKTSAGPAVPDVLATIRADLSEAQRARAELQARLTEDFQDELATLNLQLNMAEERSGRLQRENQELVDRWMARMGREAEAMNDASKFS
ncbi:hypothetical protein CNMCM5793_003249 [Aspergillus hiratsukae]|uniref:Autophagy-related protein 16 domain-containing protein n=1 Tax=Aspergillus hiratsukae TaxID=1194566 RepID=A0A8H6P3L5_9EURO|nr:hypothetical protein CNMCM5793_003249 [Aspergillus hiratsukae]KAF7162264.1 hypothetical protein CNMCM6106_009213 [Aspergillus hiratsukae]